MLIPLIALTYLIPLAASLLSLAWIYYRQPDAFDSFPPLFQAEFKPHASEFTRRFITRMFVIASCVPLGNLFLMAFFAEYLLERKPEPAAVAE